MTAKISDRATVQAYQRGYEQGFSDGVWSTRSGIAQGVVRRITTSKFLRWLEHATVELESDPA